MSSILSYLFYNAEKKYKIFSNPGSRIYTVVFPLSHNKNSKDPSAHYSNLLEIQYFKQYIKNERIQLKI
jgi:hypothetical protein